MSKWDCVKCGHDTDGEGGNPWFGDGGGRICKDCCAQLARKFFALFLPKSGPAWDDEGPIVQWHQVAEILASPHERDVARRMTTYCFDVADKTQREMGVRP